jgi:nuclear-control-of-ATPase protein 2
MFSTFFMVPFDLARQECEYKRKELEKLRDQRAEVLGTLAVMRGSLRKALEESNRGNLAWFVDSLERLTQDESASSPLSTPPSTDTEIDVVALIQRFANITLQSHRTRHVVFIQNLRRPSRMTLLWPRLLLLPPMALYLLRLLYASRTSLFEIAKDAGQTVDRFSRGWLLEPLKDVLRTVRAGGEDGIIIKKEGIAADLDVSQRCSLQGTY